MRIKLHRAAAFGKQDYPCGTHEIPDSFASHWFFVAMVKSGEIEVLDAPQDVAPLPLEVVSEDFEGLEVSISEDFEGLETSKTELLDEVVFGEAEDVDEVEQAPAVESVSHGKKKKSKKR